MISSTNKTDCYNITEILLKVALNTITPHGGSFNPTLSYEYNNDFSLNYIYLYNWAA
jgi:hypothetical protein